MERQSSLIRTVLTILVGVLVLLALYIIQVRNYLLFHTIAEIFSIVIACGMFMIAWHSRRFMNNDYLLLLGVAYLFVAGLDLLHTLAYKGMGVFRGYDDDNLPPQIWLVARYVESVSLLVAPWFIRRKLHAPAAFFVYAAVSALMLTTIFYWQVFPAAFVKGVGLTRFKIINEYVICAILLGAMVLLLRQRREFDPRVLRLLVLSIIATIGTELSFTIYVHLYGFSNMIGHYLKIVSFYCIYKAIIETGLEQPYNLLFRKLKQSEELLREQKNKLQEYLDIAGVILLAIGADQKVALINRKGCEVLGLREQDIVGKNWFDLFVPERIRGSVRAGFERLIAGNVEPADYFENPVITKKGERLIAWRNAVLRDRHGAVAATLSSGEDITERKQAEVEREQLIAQLRDALARVKVLSGLLPICASCKKIRDDRGYWNQIEVYIHDHSDAVFSHGICPECARNLYPDICKDLPEAS